LVNGWNKHEYFVTNSQSWQQSQGMKELWMPSYIYESSNGLQYKIEHI
jgi:hypothetical protein